MTKPMLLIAEDDHYLMEPVRVANLVDLVTGLVGGDLSAESIA